MQTTLFPAHTQANRTQKRPRIDARIFAATKSTDVARNRAHPRTQFALIRGRIWSQPHLTGRTRTLRKATGPWSACSITGPVGISLTSRQAAPVGYFNSTFSWMT